jgi:hypothetical protein
MALKTQVIEAFLKKYPLAIGCGALSLLLLIGVFVRGSNAGDLSTQLKQKEQEGQMILENVRNGAGLSEQFETLSTATRDLESRLIRGTERARNQQYFYRIESEAGVAEISLQPVSASPDQRRGPRTLYTGVGYVVTVQGDYRQILDFLGRLESGSHFYRLIRGSVQRSRQGGAANAGGAITLSLNLELLGLP